MNSGVFRDVVSIVVRLTAWEVYDLGWRVN